ncbi:hypothetical protein ACSBR2_017688 [Camellia fascicularis]
MSLWIICSACFHLSLTYQDANSICRALSPNRKECRREKKRCRRCGDERIPQLS